MDKRIKTVKAALKALGYAEDYKPPVRMWPAKIRKQKTAEFFLEMAIMALNKGWDPDYSNTSQPKWYIWWRIDNTSPGRGLVFGAVFCGRTVTNVGPRLVFETREAALHAAKHFKKLYEAYYFALSEG
ncbi:hypothetical protein UFOVP74_3 [uncultured Caudovirales phage]|uniref:Uncharacterized protein n=1 Tax=uncultured Caudovirales phage TaxID=2100421 RepID=A0A6J5KVI7_9CAUD|nr:hypothetical protein UFOVP74_3 [uncultured Caudovirales phage]